ncbi:MAG: nucleoside recognition protein [Acidobacteriota bacterium]|jgi:spore maturation protein A|nr:nucleoside recognition protein [Acidobacteriota bacterium]
MLNYIWLAMVVLAVVLGGINGRIEEVTKAAIDAAGGAVTIAIGLIGVMALWLGVVKVAEDSGLMKLLSRAIAPVLKWLFPDVPPGHPAMGSMTMNIAANLLGLSNAATPLGLKAMQDLESLNKAPGVATNAMCTFLTINTGSVQLIPATMIGVMAAAGSKAPTEIIGTTLAAGVAALAVGVAVARLLQNLPLFAVRRQEPEARPGPPASEKPGEGA